jgi:hypothetical protein
VKEENQARPSVNWDKTVRTLLRRWGDGLCHNDRGAALSGRAARAIAARTETSLKESGDRGARRDRRAVEAGWRNSALYRLKRGVEAMSHQLIAGGGKRQLRFTLQFS